MNNNLPAFYKLESTQIQLGEQLENSHLFHRVTESWSKRLFLREPELLGFLFQNRTTGLYLSVVLAVSQFSN